MTIALAAFLMNSRQTFYSLTFIEEFQNMGKRMIYMIHTMTDETYAVNLTLEEKEKEDTMFALFSRCYWMFGAVAGGILGQLIPIELEGIDFCMTALFVIIFMNQWEKTDNHFSALAGMVIAVICLLVIGERNFMFLALVIVSGILLFRQNAGGKVNE